MFSLHNTRLMARSAVITIAVAGWASAEPSDSRPLDLSHQLQDSITARYQERIASRIPAGTFQVSARVSLTPMDSETSPPTLTLSAVLKSTDETGESFPGLVGPAAAITALPNRLSQIPGEFAATERALEARISNIEISVLLSPRFGGDYKLRFEKWLKAAALAEYGAVAGVRVIDSTVTAHLHENATLGAQVRNEHLLLGFALPVFLLILGLNLAVQRSSDRHQADRRNVL